jgi:3-oxoacyl-(acyl-carrier-protein) synthase
MSTLRGFTRLPIANSTASALSEHGRSFSYDSKASGFGRGEGAACLLIKRVDDAIRDGDPIHAIIRNTACNHGGRSDGITLPNVEAQKKLLHEIHRSIGLDPAETPVVEVSRLLYCILAIHADCCSGPWNWYSCRVTTCFQLLMIHY